MNDQQRVRDLSIILPLAGLFLFSPLLIAIVREANTIFGLPSLPIYVFLVWLSLILVCRFLSKKLNDQTPNNIGPDLEGLKSAEIQAPELKTISDLDDQRVKDSEKAAER